jgi:SWI/SNF-related matrix-associated actin-dependent regulator 1 of chromatin subfamily A
VETVLLLTGTPVLNSPKDLIMLLQVMRRLDVVGGWKHMMEHYCNAHKSTFGMEFGPPRDLDDLNVRMRSACYIRREKSQVLKELPEKQRSVVPMPLSNESEYAFAEQAILSYLAQEKGKEAALKASRAEYLVKINTLRKLAAHGKMDTVREWVGNFLESGEKLVLFAHHIEVQNALAEAFEGCAVLRGEDDSETRQENVDRFQKDPNCHLIVCSLKAGGVGITLTSASNVAFVEQGWNEAEMLQAEDRVHRIGQRNAVNCWYLLARNTIDEDMMELIRNKASVAKAATEGTAEYESGLLEGLMARVQARAESRKKAR